MLRMKQTKKYSDDSKIW